MIERKLWQLCSSGREENVKLKVQGRRLDSKKNEIQVDISLLSSALRRSRMNMHRVSKLI